MTPTTRIPDTTADAKPTRSPLWVWLVLLAILGWIGFVTFKYFGFLKNSPISPNPLDLFHYDYFNQFFGWQILGFLILGALSWWRRSPGRMNRIQGGYLVLSSLAFLGCAGNWTVPVFFLCFAAWCVGSIQTLNKLLRRWIAPEVASWGIGLPLLISVWIAITFVLGVPKMLRFWLVLPLAVAMALPGLIDLGRSWRAVLSSSGAWLDELNGCGWVALEGIWLMLTLTLACSSVPELGSDSCRQYLPLIRFFATIHGLRPQFIDWGRLMPKALQAALTPAFQIGGTQCVKWFDWAAVAGVAVLFVEEIRQRTRQTNLALFAGAAVLSCPLLFHLAAITYMDQYILLINLAGFATLFRALRLESRGGLYLSAFLMGCVSQIKYNAVIFFVVWTAALLIMVCGREGLRAGLRRALPPILFGGLAAFPWFAYTWWFTGNPVFPYLNGVFKSPYWPAGKSTAMNLEQFRIGLDPLTLLRFPWYTTFQTSRLGELSNGDMGLWLLALQPLLLFNWRKLAVNGLEMGLCGLAMFIGLSLSTQYARYWIPALPMILCPMIVSLGCLIRKTGPATRRLGSSVLALPLAVALLLPLAFWIAFWRYPWNAYTGAMPERQYQNMIYHGFEAVQDLNRRLGPKDGVICTGYTGVYLAEGRSNELACWQAAISTVTGLTDKKSLPEFIKGNQIKYWLFDYDNYEELRTYDEAYGLEKRYLTDERLVAADDCVAIYDVTDNPRPPRFVPIVKRYIPMAMLVKPDYGSDKAGWNEAAPKDATRTESRTGGLLLKPECKIEYYFSVPAKVDLLKVALGLSGGVASKRTAISIEVAWLDKRNQFITNNRSLTASYYNHDAFSSYLFGRKPQGAVSGRLSVRITGPKPITMQKATLTFSRDLGIRRRRPAPTAAPEHGGKS